jgi:K+-sensing histidine kinase KdpD
VQHTPPIPANEMERLLNLSEFDIDYSNLENNFKDLIYLAAKIAGTDISLINLIDSYTQWTISNYGLSIDQMPREDSVCQYTILNEDHFEVLDLSADDRFQDKDYVKNPLNLRYYFGIPLKTSKGYNLGALCVMDPQTKSLNPEKIELLKLVANEILVRLNTIKLMHDLKKELNATKETQQKVIHDIRSPLSGIIGLTEIINEQGEKNNLKEVLEMISLINESSRSLIELTDEILSTREKRKSPEEVFDLALFKSKILKLYGPQALHKGIKLDVSSNPDHQNISFAKEKLLQITGNLIANAIKFTPKNGAVRVGLALILANDQKKLKIEVADSGIGLDEQAITKILKGDAFSTQGTTGEKGFGFGLATVKNLVYSLNGNLEIFSEKGLGSTFVVTVALLD